MRGYELFGLASLLIGCNLIGCNGAAPPTPPDTPPAPEPEEVEPDEPAGPEAIETGRDCATAEAECDGGMCKTHIKNSCDSPVTCELLIMALCQSSTDRGEARGKARGTIPGGKTDTFQAVADCEGKSITATMVETLTCK